MNNRIFIAALFLVANLLISRQGISQGTTTLHVIDMPGFPDLPQDTVYEQNTYAFNIVIANNTNMMVAGGLSVEIKVDSITTTLISSPATQIQAGDTTTLIVPVYNFTQPQFKVGNNIVVVWPAVNGSLIPVDSFITNVFFIPLSSLGTHDPASPQLLLYPVPASGQLHFETSSGNTVEYVRIFDMSGHLVVDSIMPENRNIDISGLEKGLYIIEAVMDGRIIRKKFLRD